MTTLISVTLAPCLAILALCPRASSTAARGATASRCAFCTDATTRRATRPSRRTSPTARACSSCAAGPARLYERELRGRIGSYVALDASERFVARLRRRGVDARRADVATAELPVADVVVMQASLYHFLPAADAIVRRMRAAARASVIIAEPVRNLASSRLGIVARLGARRRRDGRGRAAAALRRRLAAGAHARRLRRRDRVPRPDPRAAASTSTSSRARRGAQARGRMSRLPFNRPLRTGGESARIAAALERGWTGGNGPAGEHCQALIRELTGAQHRAHDALLHRGAGDDRAAVGRRPRRRGDHAVVHVLLDGQRVRPARRDAGLRRRRSRHAEHRSRPAPPTRSPTARASIVAVHYGGVGCDMAALGELCRDARADARRGRRAVHRRDARRPRAGRDRRSRHALLPRDEERLLRRGRRAARQRRALAERAEILQEKGTDRQRFARGEVDKYTWVDVGSSFLMSDVTAALLAEQLERVAQITAARLRDLGRLPRGARAARARRRAAPARRSRPARATTRTCTGSCSPTGRRATRSSRRSPPTGSARTSTTSRCTPRRRAALRPRARAAGRHRRRRRPAPAPAAVGRDDGRRRRARRSGRRGGDVALEPRGRERRRTRSSGPATRRRRSRTLPGGFGAAGPAVCSRSVASPSFRRIGEAHASCPRRRRDRPAAAVGQRERHRRRRRRRRRRPGA